MSLHFYILTALCSPKAALFVPESAFELLVRRQLARFKEPALQCVDLVYDGMYAALWTCVDMSAIYRTGEYREHDQLPGVTALSESEGRAH
jgi:hypothetical protein